METTALDKGPGCSTLGPRAVTASPQPALAQEAVAMLTVQPGLSGSLGGLRHLRLRLRKSGCEEGREIQKERGRRPSSLCAIAEILLVSVSTERGTPFPTAVWGSLGARDCS